MGNAVGEAMVMIEQALAARFEPPITTRERVMLNAVLAALDERTGVHWEALPLDARGLLPWVDYLPCRVASKLPIDVVSMPDEIDSVKLDTGDIVLADQRDPTENGAWVFRHRTKAAVDLRHVSKCALVRVSLGAMHAQTWWQNVSGTWTLCASLGTRSAAL